MRKHLFMMKIVLLLFFISSLPLYGQSQVVSGTVTDAAKKVALHGVTIKVVGTNIIALTNEKGAFSVKATFGQTLLVTYIGFETKRLTVSGTSLNIAMVNSVSDLEEVVVAMDIKRNPRELGYSAQKVSGADIKETQRDNFINSLQGRVAGLTVTPTSGVPGASTSIVLRGFNSMSLSNQPLFVIDGIIMDNSTIDASANIAASSGQSNTSNDFTNRMGDLNPNDIESLTVLKGPEATVLYGSAASNGAIVITTKKARMDSRSKHFGVNNLTYDNSFRFQSLQNIPATFNGYQNGLNGVASATFYAFGPAFLPGTTLYDNVGNFFKASFGQTQNVAVDFGTAKSGFRFSGSYYDQTGVVPNTSLNRYNFRLSNNSKIGKHIDINPAVTYTHSENDKVLKGAGGYLLDLFLWPGTDDAQNYQLPNGHKRYLLTTNNPASDATLGTTSETDNPFFAVNRNLSRDKTDNILYNLGINFNPIPWLTLSGRFGYQYTSTVGFQYRDPESASQSSLSNQGQLDNYWTKYYGYNHTITATAKKSMGKFDGRFTVGSRWNQTNIERFGVSGSKDSTRRYDSSGTAPSTRARLSRSTLYTSTDWNQYKNDQIAYFGEATIGYDNVVFLTGSLAFESSSVLPSANRNYSYPGGSLSIIMSDIFPKMKGSFLNFWKLRTSLASTARLPDPYTNQSNYVPTVTSTNQPPVIQYGFTNANPDLRPEKQSTYEAGTEFRLFNIINADIDYYRTEATGQIAQGFRASYGTGFILNTANNSSVRNQGLEITLSAQIIQKKDFSWNIQFNFNHMWNKVLAIPPPIAIAGADYYDASTWLYGNARGGLQEGRSTGTITSYGYKRQDLTPTPLNGVTANNGQILVSPTTGVPVVDATFRVHGDRTPNITLGTLNRFTYKNWALSFLWDMRVGGDVFNGTNQFLTTWGKSKKTADRLTPRVISGIVQDGLQNTATPTKNTIQVTPYNNYLYYNASYMPEEDYIEHNIKFMRLRDLSLTYTVSPAFLRKKIHAFKSFGLFVTCNDLVLFTNYSGADPATNGGNASLKGVGATGFDYGNIGAPLSFNGGFRVGF